MESIKRETLTKTIKGGTIKRETPTETVQKEFFTGVKRSEKVPRENK